jgi:outer membrane murein-binding lipoprotein Lpp
MRLKALSLASIIIAAFVLSGCDSGRTQTGPKEVNVLGIAKYEKADYSPSNVSTFAVSTDELYTRRNFSGDKATFLWGLVTVKDY